MSYHAVTHRTPRVCALVTVTTSRYGAARSAGLGSSRSVRQPNHVLAHLIAGHKAKPRPRASKEWLAATKHDGVKVDSILINKTKVG
jgi:hypothetical protein